MFQNDLIYEISNLNSIFRSSDQILLYVSNPKKEKEKVIYSSYAKTLGRDVNPVLREGTRDQTTTKFISEVSN